MPVCDEDLNHIESKNTKINNFSYEILFHQDLIENALAQLEQANK